MATRNTPSRLIPGQPLAGILRRTAYEARRTTRRAQAAATGVAGDCNCPPGPEGPTGPQGPQGTPGSAGILATELITTGPAGTFTWNYGPFTANPVITATVVSANARFATINGVTTSSVLIRVWDAAGVLVPNVAVRMIAFEAP